MTQRDMVLTELCRGVTMTAYAALVELGIGRLAPRIEELRREGWDIKTTMHNQVNKSGRYAEYRLDRGKEG